MTGTAPPPSLAQSQALPDAGGRLDTFHGVFLPCLQSILGVILFLRLTHITSQAGCLYTTAMILISSASTLFTWSSLSAIATNGQIASSSGPYYIISRTLGADIGCSLSLLYYIGSSLSCSMFALGAVEAVQHSVRAYYARWGYGFSGHLFPFDVQVLAIVVVGSTAACVHFGTEYTTLFSNIFLCATLTSISCVIVGCVLFALGYEADGGGLQVYDRSFVENVWPRYEPDPYTGIIPDFFSCLALIYPCVTGMLSGMSKSLLLKNPSHSIPKGTFWAIISCTGVYLAILWLFGMTISNRTLKVDKFVTASVSFPHEIIVRVGVVVSCMGLMLGSMSTAPNLISAMSSDGVLPFLGFLKPEREGAQNRRALWFTAAFIALPTLAGNIDFVAPFVTVSYLLMYSGVNSATCISGYVRPPGFRPSFRYFHWSASFVGFVWCLGLSFCISSVATFYSLLAFFLLHGYIKKARKLTQSGIKWGTLGSAVRYNIVSSALNSLAKSAATSTTVPSEVILEEGVGLRGTPHSSSFSSDGSVLAGRLDSEEEWVHFQQNADFHAKNWRPQLLSIVDVDPSGNPINLHLMSLAAQLQQTGRGINVVISIIDRSRTDKAASVACAIDDICAEADSQLDGSSEISDMTRGTGFAPTHFAPTHSASTDRWGNEEESGSVARSGIDHHSTVKLIQRSKALLMMQMNVEGMDGFAEVSTTDGKFFEAVWSAVIHTGLGPLSPNTILLCLPTFLAFEEDALSEKGEGLSKHPFAHEHDSTRAKHYLRTINGILNLGKAVILFKGDNFPRNGTPVRERGIIDIWWIVHDGGLLLLLPFLLSKHPVWEGANQDGDGKKKRFRRGHGARLRLFAVTTNEKENPDRLCSAVREHLERLRINAEVVVVDCLAGTCVADYMRDSTLADVGPGLDAGTIGSKDEAAAMPNTNMWRQMGFSSPASLNPVASLRKEGISTHNMTLGEVFASPAREESSMELKTKSILSSQSNDNLIQLVDESKSMDQWQKTAALWNKAMRRYSSDANLVVTNLPFIRENQCAKKYFRFVDTICDGIDNVMLVRGSGAEVITTYA